MTSLRSPPFTSKACLCRSRNPWATSGHSCFALGEPAPFCPLPTPHSCRLQGPPAPYLSSAGVKALVSCLLRPCLSPPAASGPWLSPANLFANRYSKLFPQLHNPQSPGKRLHLFWRAGWGCWDARIEAAGCGRRGLGWEDWDAEFRDVKTGMHGSEIHGSETQDAGTAMWDAGTTARDISAQLLTVRWR